VRLIDDRYRLLGIINPLDLAVLVVVLAAALAVWSALYDRPGAAVVNEVELDPLTFQVVCANVVGYVEGDIEVGDQLFKQLGPALGTVVSVTSGPSKRETYVDGELTLLDSAASEDVLITVEALGEPTDQGVNVNGVLLGNNMLLDVATARFQARLATVRALTLTEE